MRVAVIGAGGRHKTEASIVRALRTLGHESRLVNAVGWARYAGPLSGRMARYLVDAFEPDFLLLTRHAIELGEPDLRTALRGRRAAFWYFDMHPKESVIALGRLVGTIYVTSLGRLDSYRAAGIAVARFLPQGVDPEWDMPAASAPSPLSCDVSFVGSGGYPHRYPVLRAIASMSRLEIRGPGWNGAPRDLPVVGGPVHGTAFARVVSGAAISLGANAHPEQDIDRASASNRMWKIFGCGGFYLGPQVPDIESFAVGGQHCAWYSDAGDATEQARHYLSRPEERARIAQAGREHALGHHTYAHRLRLLLEDREYQMSSSTPQTIR